MPVPTDNSDYITLLPHSESGWIVALMHYHTDDYRIEKTLGKSVDQEKAMTIAVNAARLRHIEVR